MSSQFSTAARVECENCGRSVSNAYARVFNQDGESVECCPFCPDITRRNGIPDDARASRRVDGNDGGGTTTYELNYQEGGH